MAAASFEALCAGFCEIARVPVPVLSADEFGRVAFHVVLRGVTVNVVHCESASADHVFLFFDLGALPASGPGGVGALQALLDGNFMLAHPTPVFARNPSNGNGVVKQVYSLFEATPSGLHQLVGEGIERVTRWREQLADADTSAAADSQQAFCADLMNRA
ncbi:CesT family type III secretion system chaperone [Ramlibacter albus]|uniref:CesT family type III secretion system chaperone n=1 Tax=Ramlibacter albus TaxID=2079448 RepID=A0A923M7S6_9BURK|nr:CesT family type III secretion system chaperone [Ramlibacter albus]MBC5764381.1 CesT family type III secretion system chaperone [Ramlibacter albus]